MKNTQVLAVGIPFKTNSVQNRWNDQRQVLLAVFPNMADDEVDATQDSGVMVDKGRVVQDLHQLLDGNERELVLLVYLRLCDTVLFQFAL